MDPFVQVFVGSAGVVQGFGPFLQSFGSRCVGPADSSGQGLLGQFDIGFGCVSEGCQFLGGNVEDVSSLG